MLVGRVIVVVLRRGMGMGIGMRSLVNGRIVLVRCVQVMDVGVDVAMGVSQRNVHVIVAMSFGQVDG